MNGKKEYFDAVRSGDISAVNSLLDAQPELLNARNDQGQSGVLLAAYTGRKEIRDVLIARGAVLELHEASAAGQFAKVKELVEQDPALAKSFSPDGFPVLALAAVFGHADIAKYLHENGADVNAVSTNATGYTALTGAVASGHTAIVDWLISRGANVNHRYGHGYSPLLTAAADGRLEIVKMLLENGADPRAATNDGKTALQIAQDRGHKQVADYLRGRG
ncbi:MAG TPA: ankyrin repeat domain-containing protein [Candidatus Acidoferrum sp.]|nr:ankyrin repeat domain-containing protein [Candidatus Acidoferrum sp.]